MHVWMLTGDNGYTARTVAVNCGLIIPDIETVRVTTAEIPNIPPKDQYQVLIEGSFVRKEL